MTATVGTRRDAGSTPLAMGRSAVLLKVSLISAIFDYHFSIRGSLYALTCSPASSQRYSNSGTVYNVWGTLVASFMTNESVDGTNGYDGAEMKVITSVDGGNSWGSAAVTGPAASHWPGIFNRDATHILALYSRDGLGAVTQLYELQN